MPRFSVVIPTYNRADALRQTVQSVLDQTFSDFEIIIVDDGSTDLTRMTVEKFADSRIRYFWIKNSGGPATPRNLGICEAKGEWVAFLDSDDLWCPSKLAEIVRSIDHDPDVDAIGNNEEVKHSDGRVEILRYGPVTPDFYRTLLIEGNRCSTSAMTVRRSFIEEHGIRFDSSPEYVIVEDYDFWMRLAQHGARFRFIDQVLGEYMIGNEGISRNFEKARRNWMSLLKKHVFFVQQFDMDRERLWRRIRARAYATNAVAELRLHRPFLFIKSACHAFILSPTSLAAWLYSRVKRRFNFLNQ